MKTIKLAWVVNDPSVVRHGCIFGYYDTQIDVITSPVVQWKIENVTDIIVKTRSGSVYLLTEPTEDVFTELRAIIGDPVEYININ